MDSNNMLSQSSIISAEFDIYSYLEFKLKLEQDEYESHYWYINERLKEIQERQSLN